jgi:hypothetical protein
MHLWFAVGHLAEAEDESISEDPGLSADIRKVRLALMGQEGVYSTLAHIELLTKARIAFSGSYDAETAAICERIRRGSSLTAWE